MRRELTAQPHGQTDHFGHRRAPLRLEHEGFRDAAFKYGFNSGPGSSPAPKSKRKKSRP